MSEILTSRRYTGMDAISAVHALLAEHMPAPRLLVIADDATWEAARPLLAPVLLGHPHYTVHSLGQRVHPTHEVASDIASMAASYDGLLAVGSGTINDLCKYASFLAQKPYAVVATACSMNGYSSANASLEAEGFKQSFAARPPVAVIADTRILLAAPKRLTRAGIGDTLCRTTVEADMLLSHMLLDTPYPREVFDKLRQHEEVLLTGLMKAREQESAYIECLITALLDAGDAMTTHGSSAVASQGEHMIAHTLELKYGSELHNLLHGELIAVTSLTMSQFQHRMLLGSSTVKRMDYPREQFLRQFGKRHEAALFAAYQQKLLSDAQVSSINARLVSSWPEMVLALSHVMIATNALERAFIHSGLHTTPSQIGLADERYRFATSYAHLTRERFTFLDLAAMNVKRMK
jgi:glycerol-1-phosphate dehydrogenase [NAD(P)+]